MWKCKELCIEYISLSSWGLQTFKRGRNDFIFFVLLIVTVTFTHLACVQQSHGHALTLPQPIQWFCNQYFLLNQRSTFDSQIMLHLAHLFGLLIILGVSFLFLFLPGKFLSGAAGGISSIPTFSLLICGSFTTCSLTRSLVEFLPCSLT